MRQRAKNKTIYNRRKLIVQEFDLFDRDKGRMRDVYGDGLNGPVDALVKAIYNRRRLEKHRVNDNLLQEAHRVKESGELGNEEEEEEEPLVRKRKVSAGVDTRDSPRR